MFIFTQTINLYDEDRGFNVTYKPDDARLSPISQWVRLPPLDDPSEILRQLGNASPQGEWQRQIDALSVDTSIYQSLIGTQVKVEAPTDVESEKNNPFTSETIDQIKSKII
jgi:hypothetical protein